MDNQELEYFLGKYKATLYYLILAICLITSVFVYTVTSTFWFGLAAFAGLVIIGFGCYRYFTIAMFVDLKAYFIAPLNYELNRYTQIMIHLLGMIITGKILPVTRDELIYSILLSEGHKVSFCHLLKLKECSHILEALHESLDRNITSFRGENLPLPEKLALEQLRNLKEQLPPIE